MEMDPYVRKGKGKAWKARVLAERARKGPPVAGARAVPRVPACISNIAREGGVGGGSTRPVGVVGEELSSASDHHNRAGGAERSELVSVSQLTPRISVFQGLFDELEFSDWYYEQYSGFSLRDIPINLMRDTRNQPAFSLFSWTREAG